MLEYWRTFLAGQHMKKRNHSVSTKITHYLILIIIFASMITALSLLVIMTKTSDAELVNVSGSLRMQSYRMLHAVDYRPERVPQHLQEYRKTLDSPVFSSLNHQLLASKKVKLAYNNIVQNWDIMEGYIKHGQINLYKKNIENYVEQVDRFVIQLQHFAEFKQTIVMYSILLALFFILAMVSYVIWFAQKKVVNPLEKLMIASAQVQMGQFKHMPLETNQDNEIGRLSMTFTEMARRLQDLYLSLEDKVAQKTQKLRQVNRSLTMLNRCSQLVTTTEIDAEILKKVLAEVALNEHLHYIELKVHGAEHWNTALGQRDYNIPLEETCLTIENQEQELGVVVWQAGLPCPNVSTMKSVARMLSRSLYFHKMQRQQRHLLLMEERSIIARELHDSLAQVLSYLKIQLTLLKHQLKKESKNSEDSLAMDIISDFEQALTDGYTQLRELLATFRLTVQEANLKMALEEMIDSLSSQTEINLKVNCSLPSQAFDAQQLVHALQIVREATLNAIKHSQANNIEVIATINEDGEYELIVQDDGIGIESLEEPEGHYGLNIMQERASLLNASLSIKKRKPKGTIVKFTLNQQDNRKEEHNG